MNVRSWSFRLFLFLAVGGLACGGDQEEPQTIEPLHVFDVDFEFPQPEYLARHMSGMQGSPAPLIAGDSDLTEVYSANLFGVVRVGQDVFCNYSLEGLFDDPEKPSADPASYNFDGIDYLLQAVRNAGALVLWQASYDIGYDGKCDVVDGRHAGSGPVEDALKHAEVVSFALRHFNNDTDWDIDAQDFNVKHVEFVNDPFGLGGYTEDDEERFMEDFTSFAQGVKAAFAAESEEINILGPAHRIRAIEETFPTQNSLQKSFLLNFVDRVAGTGVPLDVLTVQTRFDSAYDSAIALGNLRKYMDEIGLTALPIWVTEVGPSPELEDQLRNADDIEYLSAYWGAHLSATKIAWQTTVERTIAHRGTRRTTAPNAGTILESPFFSEDGLERQAVQPFTAFLIMRNQPILEGSSVTSDGTALLAVRHKEKDKMWLLIGNPGDGSGMSTYPLNVKIRNLPKSVSTVSYKYSVVDVTTGDRFEFSQTGDLEVNDEKLVFERIIPTPSTIFVELTW